MSASTRRVRSMRSSWLNIGVLPGLAAMATTTSSKMPAARRTRSLWPLVMGSNVPGSIARRGMQQMIPDLTGLPGAMHGPACGQRRQFRAGGQLHITETTGGQQPALVDDAQCRLEQAGIEGRIQQDEVPCPGGLVAQECQRLGGFDARLRQAETLHGVAQHRLRAAILLH